MSGVASVAQNFVMVLFSLISDTQKNAEIYLFWTCSDQSLKFKSPKISEAEQLCMHLHPYSLFARK